jgi:hypothetical protein
VRAQVLYHARFCTGKAIGGQLEPMDIL